MDYNIGLYNGGLEAETGQSTTWHDCGSFRLAYDEDEMDWLRYTRSVNIALGFNSEVVDPAFVRAHHPFYNLDGVLGALHTPDDGMWTSASPWASPKAHANWRHDHSPLPRHQRDAATEWGVAGRHRTR